MSYEERNSYSSEVKGYTSQKDVKAVGRINGNVVAADIQREIEIKRNREKAITEQNEQGQSRQLIELGKLASFIEHFDMIKVDAQNLPPVEKIEEPKKQESFIKGYKFGKVLISKGFTEENYHNFCQEYERKYGIKKGINR